jgi:uncharacterized protein
MSGQRFSVLNGSWVVVRLPPSAPVPSWALRSDQFISITRTRDELSIVSSETLVTGVEGERGWSILKVHGPIPFDQVGLLASIAAPLASRQISLFAISTFDTDYILIKSVDLTAACECLAAVGHTLVP